MNAQQITETVTRTTRFVRTTRALLRRARAKRDSLGTGLLARTSTNARPTRTPVTRTEFAATSTADLNATVTTDMYSMPTGSPAKTKTSAQTQLRYSSHCQTAPDTGRKNRRSLAVGRFERIFKLRLIF